MKAALQEAHEALAERVQSSDIAKVVTVQVQIELSTAPLFRQPDHLRATKDPQSEDGDGQVKKPLARRQVIQPNSCGIIKKHSYLLNMWSKVSRRDVSMHPPLVIVQVPASHEKNRHLRDKKRAKK